MEALTGALSGLLGIVIIIFVIIFPVVIARWAFRINTIVEKLERIVKLLEALDRKTN